MKTSTNYKSLQIGAIFTIASLFLTLTFIIPILSVLPGVAIEPIAKLFISNEPYSNIGGLTIVLLVTILLIALLVSILTVRKLVIRDGTVSKNVIVAIMFIFYFIVHPLGFYIYWGFYLNYRDDGQLLFGAVSSFPYSSFSFVIIGLILDFVKNAVIKSGLSKATVSIRTK